MAINLVCCLSPLFSSLLRSQFPNHKLFLQRKYQKDGWTLNPKEKHVRAKQQKHFLFSEAEVTVFSLEELALKRRLDEVS